jgi:predicted HTH domain antitoxin
MPNLEIVITVQVTETLNLKTLDIPNPYYAHQSGFSNGKGQTRMIKRSTTKAPGNTAEPRDSLAKEFHKQSGFKSRISLSVPAELLRSLDELARIKKARRSTLLLESLKQGAREVRIRFALEQYERGFMSVGKAAEVAEVSLAEFLSEMRKRGITPRYSLGLLLRESGKE